MSDKEHRLPCRCAALGTVSADGSVVRFWCGSFIGTHKGANLEQSRECLIRERDVLRSTLVKCWADIERLRAEATPPRPTHRVRCQRCQRVYTVATGYPIKAPHGENKDCKSDVWEAVSVSW